MRYWEPQVRAGVSESVNRRGLGRSNIPEQMANEQLAAIWARLIGGQQAQQFQASQAELNRQYGSAESAAAAARQAELERYRAELNQYYNPVDYGGLNQSLDFIQGNQTMAAGGSGSPTLGQPRAASGGGQQASTQVPYFGGTQYQGPLAQPEIPSAQASPRPGQTNAKGQVWDGMYWRYPNSSASQMSTYGMPVQMA